MRMTAIAAAFVATAFSASSQELLHQPTNSPATMPLSPAILAELDDPFFRIVLEPHPDAVSLEAIIALMTEGGLAGFQTFVVGEQIGRPETVMTGAPPQCGQPARRAVISFEGFHQPSGSALDSNAFISAFITPQRQVGPLEVMSWDESHGTYNYYKLENGTWRLRNRSNEIGTADQATLNAGCLACHVNGGPIMKEFSFPWNHWHSFKFDARYLKADSPLTWNIASDPLLQPQPGQAERLEQIIQSSLMRFTSRLIDQQITKAADGSVTVTGVKDMVDSLFKPTELNLVSSPEISGLDGGGLTNRNPRPMQIPDSFFVNVMQMRDIDLPIFQGQPLVTSVFVPGTLGVSLAEYEDLLSTFEIDTQCMPGPDTVFAWFGPEPSEFDRRMVERLTRRGVIDRNLVAAALAIDVEEPLVSEGRAALLDHVPDEISADSETAMAAALRVAIKSNLDTVADADKTEAERDFATLLADGDAVSVLNDRVEALRDEVRQSLDPSDPAKRQATLRDLYQRLIDDRQAFATLPISSAQAEFPGLFPEPR